MPVSYTAKSYKNAKTSHDFSRTFFSGIIAAVEKRTDDGYKFFLYNCYELDEFLDFLHAVKIGRVANFNPKDLYRRDYWFPFVEGVCEDQTYQNGKKPVAELLIPKRYKVPAKGGKLKPPKYTVTKLFGCYSTGINDGYLCVPAEKGKTGCERIKSEAKRKHHLVVDDLME